MIQHTGRRAELDALLARDDAQSIVALVKNESLYLKQAAMAQAISYTPWPEQSVHALYRAGCTFCLYPGEWVTMAADTDWMNDWSSALHRIEPMMGRKALQRDLMAAWHSLADDYQKTQSLGRARQRIQSALVGILEYWPQWGKKAMAHHHHTAEMLFFLSFTPSKTDWIQRGRLPLEDLILAGTRAGRFQQVITPQEDGTCLLDHWLSANPKRQRAWEQAVEQDRVLARMEEQWREQWLPDGTWDGSALQQWCQAIATHQTPPGTQHPLNHPVFRLDGLNWRHVSRHEQTALAYQARAMNYTGGSALANRKQGGFSFSIQRQLHDSFRQQMADAPHNRMFLRAVPLHPLAEGLDRSLDWAIAAGSTPTGARQIQALLDDPRAERMLNTIQSRNIAQWIIDEPSWHSWRDKRGNSVLDMRLDIENDLGRALSISKAQLLKIGRMAPGLLVQPGTRGAALDRLEMADQIRADIRRSLLKQVAEPRTGRRPARNRSM